MMDSELLEVIEHLRKAIHDRHTAGIKTECIRINASKPNGEEIATIIATFAKDDEYIVNTYEGDYFISKNPSYSLSHSIKKTNENIIGTNKWIKRWTMVNAIAALSVAVIGLLQIDRSQGKELQLIRQSLQRLENNLEMNRLYLDGIHYRFGPKDSTAVKPDSSRLLP